MHQLVCFLSLTESRTTRLLGLDLRGCGCSAASSRYSAQEMFDEIDAFGQEPQLDDDWLAEVTGEKDTFYFSTDSLVCSLPPLPGHKKSRTLTASDEKAVTQAVEEAIVSREDALAVAHHETPQLWIEQILAALEKEPGAVSFGRLLLTTGLSPGALFLGLLLGHQHWQTTQQSFYGDVSVQLLSQAGCPDPAEEINDKLT